MAKGMALPMSEAISNSDQASNRDDVKENEGSVWTDWIDACGVDLLGCDENCGGAARPFLGKVPTAVKEPEPSLHTLDYSSLHDEFLESLLFEQIQLSGVESAASGSMNGSQLSFNSTSTVTSSSMSMDTDDSSRRKRRRPIRLHKRGSPVSLRHNRVTPLSENEPEEERDNVEDAYGKITVSLADLAKAHFPHPSTYLHPQCRMQKDKNKGEAVGSNICAKGRDECLDKLRVKMRLLTDHAFSPGEARKGPATMKRRKAKVSEHLENFVETRSMIELRMGFLSMQYGVLLRWDTGRTGKITLIVLRKMCHDSFYPNKPITSIGLNARDMTNTVQSGNSSTQARDVIGEKNAILQRPDGTEVALLDPPYRIARPEKFNPASLTVTLLYATGLNHRSHWTVQLKHEDHTENVLLSYDKTKHCMVPKLGKPLSRMLSLLADVENLEIRLFEHRLRRKNQRRLIAALTVPLTRLEARPSHSAKPTRMAVPLQHDSDAAVHLEMLYISDYTHWVNQELEARRSEETQGWRSNASVDAKDENEAGPWDWICQIC